ncbi:hypothetical protein EK21DRAFT_74778 [Setomelanomma holmii]|uniref:Uncharacterized protein n=1 Tax=Setomelanomma holmii TaxID=210430 RepID=A0A9P4LJM0_9PLEO|nr:hypothetical protein EK21DRAFT_74778 [Setomelanomma holmii]
MSSKDNLALDLEHGVRRWDRARWISVFSSHNPTIREVTECLGLGLSASSSTTNRGIPKFDNPDYRKLSSEVTKLSKELPKERDALLDFAADPQSLDQELEELLGSYGPAIWSKDADRTCLLTPDPTKKTYNKDLFYEEPEHKEMQVHLHRWIIIKACYYIRNMKLKRPSGANDYDTLADIDGESQLSPHGTPHSLTPPEHDATPGADLDVKPVNGKKRKNEAFGSYSDGEEHSATSNKRPYSTMPINRRSKSPRKSLHNLLPGGHGSVENVPPLPSQKHHHLSPSPANGADAARIQLSPLSSNHGNGIVRPSSTPAPAVGGGFIAVNVGGFTAVNSTPPLRAPSRDAERTSSREPQRSPPQPQQDARKYTSPYDPVIKDAAVTRPLSEPVPAHPAVAPPASTSSTGQGLHARTSSTDRNSHSRRASPAPQNPHHAHIAPPPQPQNPPVAQQAAHERPYAPAVQTAHAYGMTLVPTQPQPPPAAVSSNHPSQPQHQPAPQPHHQQPCHTQPVLKSQPAEPPQAVSQRPVVIPTGALRVTQCEVTTMLLQWLFPRPGVLQDEPALLHHVHTLWYHGEPVFRPELGIHYDLVTHVLTTWLQERFQIVNLQHQIAAQPGISATSPALIERLLLMNDLRTLRLKWKNMSPVDGMSPEDLLVRAFCVMTQTENTEFVFKEGLNRIERTVFEFLRSEDAKIVMHRQ